jgi:2-polyprenyl-6-methoxyphenol hydroxylase-like FAD-dependent oxidoreductase
MQKDHLETTKAPFHVLIIGGGVGGLCLAQGLKQSGISVAVYEGSAACSGNRRVRSGDAGLWI